MNPRLKLSILARSVAPFGNWVLPKSSVAGHGGFLPLGVDRLHLVLTGLLTERIPALSKFRDIATIRTGNVQLLAMGVPSIPIPTPTPISSADARLKRVCP